MANAELSQLIEDELKKQGFYEGPSKSRKQEENDEEKALIGALRVEARVKEHQHQKKIVTLKRSICIGGGLLLIIVLWAVLALKSKSANKSGAGLDLVTVWSTPGAANSPQPATTDVALSPPAAQSAPPPPITTNESSTAPAASPSPSLASPPPPLASQADSKAGDGTGDEEADGDGGLSDYGEKELTDEELAEAEGPPYNEDGEDGGEFGDNADEVNDYDYDYAEGAETDAELEAEMEEEEAIEAGLEEGAADGGGDGNR